MIIIKKKELESLILTISAQTKDGVTIGLLHEKITLGLKRRLQKLLEAAVKEYQQFVKDKEECDKSEDKEKNLKELLDEEIKFEVEKVSAALIDAIETTTSYDFRIIEKISE